MKYLREESIESFWGFGRSIIVVNESVFISSAVQMISHEFLERHTSDEMTRDDERRMAILIFSF